ncbi:hypothetical protein NEOKW01_1049 [Nematocida sp. AWRm80]|nr:hypothetical protein NEOKW01_1049 [Nematocida sp. AWRm80]
MSKFFESLDDTSEKKTSRAINSYIDDESEEEKGQQSNKEKKIKEIEQICENASFKKPKDIEQFFKKLTKYNTYFSKEGLPEVLVEYLNSICTKSIPAVFKQRRSKFLEKYQMSEVILETEVEQVEKQSHLETINNTQLIESLEKRKETLLQLEKIESLTEIEMHRVNLYLISCMAEENISLYYNEVCKRLQLEKTLITEESEKNLLCIRINRCTRKILIHLQNLSNANKEYSNELQQLKEVSESLKEITKIPEEAYLEVQYFLLKKEVPTTHPVFQAITSIRTLPYEEALQQYTQLIEKEKEIEEETNTQNISLSKLSEELGHLAIKHKDFNTAIDLLEKAYYSKNIWSLPETEIALNVLCICFEKRFTNQKYFQEFKEILSQIGNNLLLLKAESSKEEISRAFIFLRIGQYKEAEAILTRLLPSIDCHTILKTRAIELLLTPMH